MRAPTRRLPIWQPGNAPDLSAARAAGAGAPPRHALRSASNRRAAIIRQRLQTRAGACRPCINA
ncbi:hypothetical protein BOSE62_70897 [Bosea sp. 62]|nr:hypothetical protein BOSE7B_50740 [Bosea sp. 7B]CAD5298084.1 hypothetical protein BOSE21B_90753 [Bosea sp. 21B]CAD5298263.1 hypothetical protein BOSE46_80829 [Bosea sp. 46]VVT61400.1 hypothetical protein BOS5A_230677 [Bosea sp. EC-HK365B]VXB16535.1 hypothetical protein BOSE127_100411 [Bosea sp. 127]VXB26855.1 hypothetical protein BOSE125_130354 [Bosea sp. 125]VXC83248.1 hypothetical protein BOSE62_70897 [Bosea sp. 62]VXC83445.1 hypothetical protein BOSE29B_80713 [Bosea sp. 29B]